MTESELKKQSTKELLNMTNALELAIQQLKNMPNGTMLLIVQPEILRLSELQEAANRELSYRGAFL